MKNSFLFFIVSFFLFTSFLVFNQASAQEEFITVATTTSTQDSGLLDYLDTLFIEDNGFSVRWVAVGSGKALEMGKNGDVDALLVHAPAAEEKFIQEGYGLKRHEVMYNDYIIVGSAFDSAKIKDQDLKTALKILSTSSEKFISRDDDSGTNKKELELWQKTGINPKETMQDKYLESGQGMMATLLLAAQKGAYTLTDRGTFIKFKAQNDSEKQNDLEIITEKDTELINQYSVIMINPEKHKHVKKALVEKYLKWWVSDKTQKAIADFKLENKQLFFPNAKK